MSQNIVCRGYQKCKDDRFTCNSGESCTLDCDGKNNGHACETATLDGSQATNVTVHCTNIQDCINADITCGTGHCHIKCEAEQACKLQELVCGSGHCIIECLADTSCDDIVIDTTSASSFNCYGAYCPFTASPTLVSTQLHTTYAPTQMHTTYSPTQIPTTVPTTVPPTVSNLLPTLLPTPTQISTTLPLTSAMTTSHAQTILSTLITASSSYSSSNSINKWMDIKIILYFSIFLISSFILICGYTYCKKLQKSKQDKLSEMKQEEHSQHSEWKHVKVNVEMSPVTDGTGTHTKTNTKIGTNTYALSTLNTLNTTTTTKTLRPLTNIGVELEGEYNDESMVMNFFEHSLAIKDTGRRINDSITMSEGITASSRMDQDTLENILNDVISDGIRNDIDIDDIDIDVVCEEDVISETLTLQLKLILYDFDQTITTIHLYHELHGGGLQKLETISDERLIEVFGGNKRIQRLDEHFNILRGRNIKIGILSFGFSRVIEKALERVNLLHHFGLIVGRDSELMAKSEGHKATAITIIAMAEKYNKTEILFVDDDLKNIASVRRMDSCQSLLVEERKGMSELHLQQIENKCIN